MEQFRLFGELGPITSLTAHVPIGMVLDETAECAAKQLVVVGLIHSCRATAMKVRGECPKTGHAKKVICNAWGRP